MSAPTAFRVLDERHSAAVSSLDHAVRADSWSRESWAQTLREAASFGIVRETGTLPEPDLVAFVAFLRCVDEAELLMIAVDPREQRRGHAQRLLAEAISRVRNAGVERIFLEVETTNESALALYQRFGFVQLYRRLNYYGAGRDADVMQLQFEQPEQPEP